MLTSLVIWSYSAECKGTKERGGTSKGYVFTVYRCVRCLSFVVYRKRSLSPQCKTAGQSRSAAREFSAANLRRSKQLLWDNLRAIVLSWRLSPPPSVAGVGECRRWAAPLAPKEQVNKQELQQSIYPITFFIGLGLIRAGLTIRGPNTNNVRSYAQPWFSLVVHSPQVDDFLVVTFKPKLTLNVQRQNSVVKFGSWSGAPGGGGPSHGTTSTLVNPALGLMYSLVLFCG